MCATLPTAVSVMRWSPFVCRDIWT